MNNFKILYLLGSGRSGTTLLSTILNSTPKVVSYGELHQFYTYIKDNNKCSCEKEVDKCIVWRKVIDNLNLSKSQIQSYEKTQKHEEAHKFIPLLLLGKKGSEEYFLSQEKLFNSINIDQDKWILDSSKYVGRFVLLKQLDYKTIKGIYVVRDIRGVINSFKKQVQTPKKPLDAIFYYLLTNTFAQIVCWMNKDVIKLRYEDLVDNPIQIVQHIYSSLLKTNYNNLVLSETFTMPHIIGGNRLKSKKSIKIKKDDEWSQKISRSNQILYYILCLPFMLLNKYKI